VRHNHARLDGYRQLNRAIDGMGVTPAHYKIFGLVALGSLFNVMEQYNVGYAGPALSKHWQLSNAQIGLLSAATFIAMAFGSLLGGRVADRLGRRSVFMANVAIFTCGAALAALSPNFVFLFVARILIGVGLGGEIALGYTVVSEIMPTKIRSVMTASVNVVAGGLGIFAASALAALVFGPALPLLGGDDSAWRWFFGVMLVPAVLLLFYRRFIPETPRYLIERGRIDDANRTLSLLASNRLRESPEIRTRTYIKVDGAAPPTGSQSGPGAKELLARDMVRNTTVGIVLTFALFGTAIALTVFMPTVLVSRGYAVGTSLLYTMCTTFAGLLGSIAGVFAAQWLRRRWTMMIGGGASIACSVGLFSAPDIHVALVCAGLMMFALFALISVNAVYLAELYPTSLRGLGMGAAFFGGQLAGGLGPLAAGYVMDRFGNTGMYSMVGSMCGVIILAAVAGPETFGIALDDEEPEQILTPRADDRGEPAGARGD
jgi:putative MFS transporter